VIAGNRDGIPIVALDLDGTLGDYHAHFLWFAENYFDRKFPEADQVNPGLRLSEFMGIPHVEYQKCKLAYRQGGLKRWMPAYEGAAELTHEIHQLGMDAWICTTRPFNRLDNVDPDTQEWLRRNEIQYEGLLFGDDKYQELYRQTNGRRPVIAAVEDLPELHAQASKLGFFTLLRDQPYNRHIQTQLRVHSCQEIYERILRQHKWEQSGPFSGNRGKPYVVK
jgi:phosphoglycolate phosphatase-like HAD superfamily hydrolase